MKFEEHRPGILNAPVTFEAGQYIPSQSYNSKQIEVGKTYTIKELLEYMIKYSDNNATFLLKENLDVAQFKKTYNNVGLPVSNIMDVNYSLSAEDFSVFLLELLLRTSSANGATVALIKNYMNLELYTSMAMHTYSLS